MTAADYRAQIARLGLTQTGAADVLGVDARSSRKWACDERRVPEPVRRLLWILENVPGAMAALRLDLT